MLENSITMFFIILDTILGLGVILLVIGLFVDDSRKTRNVDLDTLEQHIDVLQKENNRLKAENERFKRV